MYMQKALPMLACCLLAGPLLASDALTLIQEIRNGQDGVEIKNHVTSVVPVGDYVYFGIQYTGVIKCFRRDAGTGKLTFVSDTQWGKKKDNIALCLAGGRLYGRGAAGHATSDRDSRGLRWWEIDRKTGALTEKGKLEIPVSSGIVASSDGGHVYVLHARRKSLAHFVLGEDGTPKLADTAVFKDAKGRLSSLTLAPDGESFYVLWAGEHFVVGHARIGKNGALTVKESIDLPQLSEGVTYPRKKWGWGWGRSMFMPPDSSELYVEFCNYTGKDRHLARCSRDPQTGAIAYKDRTDATTGRMMVRLGVAFEPSGVQGYFISGSESKGNVVGWFLRDPKAGKLTYGGHVKQTKGSGPCCLAHDAERGILYVGTWRKNNIYVLKTTPTSR